MPLKLVIPPTALPIALPEAKLHLRQTQDFDDALIAGLIAAASEFASEDTQRQLVAARYALVLDAFPGPSEFGVPFGIAFSMPGHAIEIPRTPLLQVVSITYTAMDGTTQTMDPTTYVVEGTTEPARITPTFGKIWPVTLPQIGAVTVTFDAGYAIPLAVTVASPGTITPGLGGPLTVGQAVLLSNTGGALPGGLTIAPGQKAAVYYVQSANNGVYTLSAAPGGAAIAFTDAGTGTSFLGQVPDGIRAWMNIRVGTLYENREEVAILNRGKMEVLPYIDRLLDAYRVITY